jgi:PKD repeat protein
MTQTLSNRDQSSNATTSKRQLHEQLRRKLAALAAVGAIGLASLASAAAGAGFGSGAAHAETGPAPGFRSISAQQTIAAGQAETITAVTVFPADTMTNLPRVQWGDGTEQVPTVTAGKVGDSAVSRLSATHTYQQAGNVTIILTYFPNTGGAPLNANVQITVTQATNNPPTTPAPSTVPGGFRQIVADQKLLVGQAGKLSAITVFPADTMGNRFPRVQWGDGTEMVPSVTPRKVGDSPASQISATHTYQKAGNYTIVLSYFPNTGGASLSANIQVTVTNPTGTPTTTPTAKPMTTPTPQPTTPQPVSNPTGQMPFDGPLLGLLQRLLASLNDLLHVQGQ